MTDNDTYTVRFANGQAIQAFRRASDLLDEQIEDSPWNESLQEIRQALDDAWSGLTFRFAEES